MRRKGGVVARVFAREGARVFLTGRTLESLDEVAEEIARSNKQRQKGQVEENL
jgi:NADP-dependent 3-hydroxy acid dehydrogenase YdfG